VLSVANRVEIKTDTNNLNAFLVYRPVDGYDKPLEMSEVKEVISLWKVKFGVDEKAIERFLELQVPDVPFPFAKGIPPKESEDAQIYFNFDMDLLKEFSAGKIERAQRNVYKDFVVKKGLLIAKRKPPVEGEPGKV
jgi:uncharacterized protein (DUF342 family)